MECKNFIQKQIMYIFSLLLVIAVVSAANLTTQELIDSFDYNFTIEGTSAPTINVTNQADYMLDTDGDSVNDTLVINLTLGGITDSNFTFIVDILDKNGVIINATTKPINSTDNFAVINFGTDKLSQPKFNYSVRIYDINDTLVFRNYKIETNTYLSYETRTNVTKITDENINNNFIRINLTINSSQAITSNITVTLAYNSSTISETQEETLSSGVQVISIDFDNETIKSTHYNSNFTIDTVVVGNKIFDFNQNTSIYDYEDFAKFSYIKLISDGRIDSDNNNLSEFLEINFTVEVKTADSYTISYDLYDEFDNFVINISKTESLSTGTQNIQTLVNGTEIYKTKIDGPYVLSFAKLHIGNDTKDVMFNAHTTNQSFYTDYERPPLPDLNVTMDVVFDNINNITNITVNLTNTGQAPAFNVFLDIFDNTTYEDNRSSAFMDVDEVITYSFNTTNSSNSSLFTAIADFDNLVDETIESNNIVQNMQAQVVSLAIDSINTLNSDGTLKIYEFVILNDGEITVTDIYWNFDTSDNYIINSTINISSLAANEDAFVYVQHNFSDSGNFSITANATGLSQSSIVTAFLTISTNSSPVITTIPNIDFNEDEYNDSLDLDDYVSDDDPDSDLVWTYSGNTNIIVSIDVTTHIVNFTSSANWSGSGNIEFTVNDTTGLTDNDTILVTVNSINDVPTFNSSNPVSNLTWPEDTINESINLTENFYDIDGDNLNFTVTNTENVSIYIENVTGKVNITPNANWSGISYAVFTAIDEAGLTAVSNNITLNVTPANDKPTFTGSIPQWKWPEDIVNNSLNLVSYFSDIDGDSLNYNHTQANNISISINNDTGIVTLTPDGNFTGIRYAIFTAIDAENSTVSSNNVTLNVTPVNDIPTIDTFTPTSLTQTIIVGNSLTFNHTSSDVDGDSLTYSWQLDLVEQSTEQGWKYIPASNEVGDHNVTLNVSDGTVTIGMQWNVSVINQSDMDVYGLSLLNQNSTVSIFGFNINNTGNNVMSGINWSLDTGAGTITANNLISLQPNESVFVFTGYNYSSTGDYTVTASATNNTYTDSETITIDVPDIEVSNITVLNESGTKRIFEITIENTLLTNLTEVSWTFDTKNNTIINSTSNVTLQPNEEMFVYIDYNFTGAGTFNVNATASNGTLTDSRNLTVIV